MVQEAMQYCEELTKEIDVLKEKLEEQRTRKEKELALMRFDDMLPFTVTKACHRFCANVKTLSIFSILLLLFLMDVALSCVQDKPVLPKDESRERVEEDDRWHG
ncbi:Sucrose transport protein [Arachis hypogaea]|nr:Sucrose transport protein [Arachis hypogaea]